MANANGANIGSHDSKSVGYYDPVKVTSSLEDTLEITTRMMSDELKFKISSQEWSSNSNGDVPKCAVGGWDPHHVAPAVSNIPGHQNCR